jgi:membrane-associated phospholipid phosphatase
LATVLSAACALALGLAVGAPPSQDPPASPPVDRPFHHLFTNLGHDFRGLASRDTALIAAAATGGALAVRPADDNVSAWGRELEHSQYARLGSWLGDGWTQGGAAVVTYAIGASTKNAAMTHVGSDLIRAQLLNGLLTRGLKIFIDRERPGGGGHAFPSGHTSATFASAAVLGTHFGWKVAAPAYALGSFVAWARVRDGEHWLTDVVAGAAIGTIVGRTVARGHGNTWRVVPVVSGSTRGIFVVRNDRSERR